GGRWDGGERGGAAWGRERGGPPGWGRGQDRGDRSPDRPQERRFERREMPPEAYGPPPSYDQPRYQPRRGGYLPPQARGGVVQDYGRYRLRPPPPGYGWVRSGRSMMLMDMGTGQVFDVVPD
ncbi:RcnB family protein, partial [Phenylobacterium soli]